MHVKLKALDIPSFSATHIPQVSSNKALSERGSIAHNRIRMQKWHSCFLHLESLVILAQNDRLLSICAFSYPYWDMPGIKPGTFCVQSRYSANELY